MALFKNYKTDKDLERTGIVYTPDSGTAITIARAGGNNVKFAKALEIKTKPYRRQIEAGTLDPKLDRQMMAEVFAETVVKNWETLVGEEGEEQLVQGIEADPDNLSAYQGEPQEHGDLILVPFNKHNVVETLLALPDVFRDMQAEANRTANFLDANRKDDAKN